MLCVTAIKLSENVKAWSVELQLLPFKTAKAVLLQTYRFLNLMAVMLCVGMPPKESIQRKGGSIGAQPALLGFVGGR
jgi:hypothetical protein